MQHQKQQREQLLWSLRLLADDEYGTPLFQEAASWRALALGLALLVQPASEMIMSANTEF